MATIKLKNGSGAPLASDLVQGEPALDLTNKRLYTEDTLGAVIEVGVNPTELNVTNNITVGGTVDGRDIATDGTKLDTVETSADVTDTANVTAAGALMDSELTSEASVKALNQGVATTDSPTFAGATINGTVTVDGLTVDGTLGNWSIDAQGAVQTFTRPSANYIRASDASGSLRFDTGGSLARMNIANNGDVSLYEDTGVTAKLTWDASDESLEFADNAKATFGAGSDLQIFHDGSNSRIREVGTGSLLVDAESVYLRNTTGDSYFQGLNGGAANVFYNGAVKLATTSTGIDVTGSISADGLTVDGTVDVNLGSDGSNIASLSGASAGRKLDIQSFTVGASAGAGYSINATSGQGELDFQTAGNSRLNIDAFGDISFYDTAGTTAKFFWDASAESLGIGTSSPSADLHIADSAAVLRLEDTDNNSYGEILYNTAAGGLILRSDENTAAGSTGSQIIFETDGTQKAKIDASGNVEIGTQATGTASSKQLLSLVNPYGNTGGAARLWLSGTNADTRGAYIEAEAQNSANNHDLIFATSAVSAAPTERMRIDSSGDMIMKGGRIKVRESDDGNDAVVISRDADEGYVNLYSSGTQTVEVRGNGNSYFNGGNVGIGSSNPQNKLDIEQSAAVSARLLATGATASSLKLEVKGGATQLTTTEILANSSGAMTFATGTTSSTEAMRIDSSGNLLVGTTSSSGASAPDNSGTASDAGVRVSGAGYIGVGINSNPAMYLNRIGTDGEILRFNKNGSKVGSIGTVSSEFYIAHDNTIDSGLRFRSGTIQPCNSVGGSNDAAVSLGQVNMRFSDLYLSGGAYLGGTAAANKLDDFEEGTWTPVYTSSGGSFTTMTMDVLEASYTKIGDTVVLRGYIRTDDVDNTGATGSVTITGLPFTAAASASVDIGYVQGFNTNGHPDGAYISSSTIFLQERVTSDGGSGSLDVADLKNGTVANSNVLIFTAVYRT